MPSLYDLPHYYDLLYPDAGPTTFYVEEAARHGRSVLELACGNGRVTVPLARRGLEVTGLDLSPTMLAAAKVRAGELAVTWVEADMTRFDLGRRFDTIIIANNSLLHLLHSDDLVACFERVRQHLAPGGVFIFDIFNPSLGLLSRRPGKRRWYASFWDEGRGGVIVEDSADYDTASQINRATLYFSTVDAHDFFVVPLHLRCIFPQELPLLLARAGLVLSSRVGEFDGRPFDGDARHQVCHCHSALPSPDGAPRHLP